MSIHYSRSDEVFNTLKRAIFVYKYYLNLRNDQRLS